MFTQVAIDNFLTSLKVMGWGMLGILVFMSLFTGVILGLVKLFPQKQEAGEE